MTPELWQRIRPLFEAGSELPPADQEHYALQVCGPDEDLRRELLSLFHAHQAGPSFLDQPLHSFGFNQLEDQQFKVGDRIAGRFEVIRHLGSGGMGDVYEASDLELGGELIALKTLRREISDDPMMLARFRHEVRMARSVSGPNVCRIHELFVLPDSHLGGIAFLTMELLQGETLAARLRTGRVLMFSEILNIAYQLSIALDSIHSVGIVHRDLKPENIMLVPALGGFRTVLMDFGVAHVRGPGPSIHGRTRLSMVGAVIGTPKYMAPEQRDGAPPTPASDIYAFGLVIYEMLFGHLPATQLSRDRFTLGSPDHYSRLTSATLRALLYQCIEQAPEKRFQSVEPISRILRRELAIAKSPFRQWPMKRIAVAALLLLICIAIAFEREAIQGMLRASEAKHIVVLPWRFQESPNENDSSLALGLAESVSDSLKLSVQSTPSSWIVTPSEALSRNTRDEAAAKREFGATMAVSAVLRRVNGDILLNARVENLATGRQIGKFTLRARADNLAQLQKEALSHLSNLMRLSTLSFFNVGQQRLPQANAPYEAYLAGSGLFKRFDKPENLNRAIKQLQDAIRADPSFAPAYTRLAEVFLMKYRTTLDRTWLQQAEHLGMSASTLDDQSTSAFVVLGQVHSLTGDSELAIHEYRHALALDGQATGALNGLADVYKRTGRIHDAEEALRRASLIRPGDWAGHNALGNFYEHFGRAKDAIGEYEKALALTPDNSAIYSNLSTAYMDLGTSYGLQHAEEMLEKAASLGASDAVYTNLSFLLILERRYRDAIVAGQHAVALNPKNPDAWGNLAAANRWIADDVSEHTALEQAVGLLQGKVETNPQNAQAQATLATYLARLGFRQQAIDALQVSLALAPQEPYALAQAASAYAMLGDPTNAKRSVEKALTYGYPKMLLAEDPYLLPVAARYSIDNPKDNTKEALHAANSHSAR